MKKRTTRLALLGTGLLLLPGWIGGIEGASPPERIHFQGVLRDSAGAPVDPSADMTFHLYDSDGGGCPAAGGTLLLTDNQGTVAVTGGLFSVALGGGAVTPGAASGLGAAFASHAEVWVEIEIGGETLCPRVRVESSAYAQNALRLEGKGAGEFLDTSATPQSKAGDLAVLGSVGIGTASPSASLHVPYGSGILLQGDNQPHLTLRFQDDDTGNNYDIVGDPSIEGISFDMNGTNTVVMTAAGRMGIGTMSPSATLDVAGTTELNGDVTVTGSNNLTVGGTIESMSGGIKFPDGTVQTSAVNALPPDTCFDNVGRFVVCGGDGTVKDNVTGLVWLEDANCLSFGTWADASIAAAQLADGQCGLSDGSSPGDWRLPTQAEWQVILDQAATNSCSAPLVPDVVGTGCCGTGTCAFLGVASGTYWTSTTPAGGPTSVFVARTNAGGFVLTTKPSVVRAWPVRVGR